MFETRFPMLAEACALGITLPFFWNHFAIASVAWLGLRAKMQWAEGYSE
jgi:hypothetical protein